jgi:hypothetical protein
LVGVVAALSARPARAVDTCKATIKGKDGTIQVSAKHVSGSLLWGWTATTQIQPFFDPTCVKATGSASRCTQGAAGTLLATTPPPDCTLQLKDGSGTCTAYVKKCTPGKRPVVEFPVRFADNGDGTVTDTKTGLMWEQTTDDGTIRDKDNLYTWSTGSPYNPDGTAFFTFLATLNGPTPFAGYGDWRLPSLTELKTIVDLSASGCGGGSPCIDQTVFGPTQAFGYWSATTGAGSPSSARNVDFFGGSVFNFGKPMVDYVRAVRSGS